MKSRYPRTDAFIKQCKDMANKLDSTITMITPDGGEQVLAKPKSKTKGGRLGALGFVRRSEGLWVHPDGRRLVIVHPSSWELRRKDDTIHGHLETLILWLEKDSKEIQ